jgi:thiamine pyrophosphate-dependent acetolactate synthase large subunit-like protein
VKATLAGLLPLLQNKADHSFLTEAQRRMQDWTKLLDQLERVERSPLRPQMVARALSDLIAPDAVISLDCGANTFFAARHYSSATPNALVSQPKHLAVSVMTPVDTQKCPLFTDGLTKVSTKVKRFVS